MITMKPDGLGLTNFTPANGPAAFLCAHGVFPRDNSKTYFAGEWWEKEAPAVVTFGISWLAKEVILKNKAEFIKQIRTKCALVLT